MKLIATFLCVILLCFGIYFVASSSFDSQDSQKLVATNSLNFSDLPANEQTKYISKDDLSEYGSYLTPISYQQNFEIKDEPINGTQYELIAQIKELRQKNRLLFEDNIDLVGKNWDMIMKLRDQKNIIEDEKKLLKSKNLEVMNDIEKQHYQNINDLTKKINEIQKESLESSKIYEQKIVELENKVSDYEKKLEQKEINFNQSVAEATKEQRINNSSLSEKNRYLTQELNAIKEKMTKNIQDIQGDLDKKNAQIDSLQQQLMAKESHINEILTKHTKELMASRVKSDETIKNFQNETKNQRDDLVKELNAKNNEISKLNNEISALKIKHQEELESSKTKSQSQIELTKHIQKEIFNQKDSEISALKQELENIKNQAKSLNLELENSKKSLSKAETKKTDDALLKANFKILNDKITSLEAQKNEISKELIKLQNKQNGATDNENKLKTEIANLQKDLEKLKELENLAKEQNKKEEELNNQVLKLKNELLQTKQNSFSKDEFDELKTMSNQREIKLQNQIVELEAQLQSLNKVDNTALNEKFKEQKSYYENKIMTLENTINSIKSEKQISSSKSNEIAKARELIKDLESENNKLKDELQKSKNQEDFMAQIDDLKDQISVLSSKENILKAQNEKLKDDFKDELMKKQQEIILLKEQQESDKTSKTSDEAKVLKEKFKVAMNSKKELEEENEELKIRIKELSEQKNIKFTSPSKPKFVAQVECDDIKTGQNSYSKACQNKVSQFLQKYNANYFFEITAIVDGGGFKYLNLAKDKIPNDEIERITNLANFGLGKDRAKSAGELIKDEFGEFAKISYANEISIKPNKRGFIIKVFE